jgi:serine/threonine protein kinase
VAIKTLDKVKVANNGLKCQIHQEIECQGHLRHQNIAHMYGYFSDSKNIYLILEYCHGGSLYGLHQKYECFTEQTSAMYIVELAKALLYCHAKNITHHDIELENIMLGSLNEIKIADFGWSVHTSTSEHRGHSRNTMCGTPDYLALKIVLGCSYDEKLMLGRLEFCSMSF